MEAVAVYLHKPKAQRIGHTEEGHSLIGVVQLSVNRVVPCLSDRVEQIVDGRRKDALLPQQLQAIGLGALLFGGNSLKGHDLSHDPLAQKTQLVHTSVGIRKHVVLSRPTDLRYIRPIG